MHTAQSCAAFFDVLSGGAVTISGVMTIGEAQAVQAVREVMAGRGTIPSGNNDDGRFPRLSGRDPAFHKKNLRGGIPLPWFTFPVIGSGAGMPVRNRAVCNRY